MLLKYLFFFFISSSSLVYAQNLGSINGCGSPVSICGTGAPRIIERPSGLINGKNGTFIMSRPPAEGTLVQLFKTGLCLEAGSDYKVVGNQLFIIGTAVPQPGEVLMAVYSPASAMELKRSAEPSNAVATAPVKGADLTQILLREALRHEFGTTVGPKSTRDAGATSLKMLEERSLGVGVQNGRSLFAPGFDGLGDGRTPYVTDRSGGAPSNGSKALDMLVEHSTPQNVRTAKDTPQ
jgi:hypothetical protein